MTTGSRRTRCAAAALALLAAATLPGCATAPASASGGASAIDPWESWNRKVFAFNDVLDESILKPVATAYRSVVPQLVRTGVSNVLGNIGDVWSAANQLLQGKVQDGLEMGIRVVTNTFFGFGGLLDWATPVGLTKRSEDFGQTLGRWGLGDGPYVVLPLLGPSSVRDTAGFVVDRPFSPSALPPTVYGRYAVTGLTVIDTRARLLSTTELLDSVALDRYAFVRDAYLQRRRDAVYDGAPPMETFDDEPPSAPPPPGRPASAPARK